MITAKEAAEIAGRTVDTGSHVDFGLILKTIRESAEQGEYSSSIVGSISFENRSQLHTLGYKVVNATEYHQTHGRVDYFTIYWK